MTSNVRYVTVETMLAFTRDTNEKIMLINSKCLFYTNQIYIVFQVAISIKVLIQKCSATKYGHRLGHVLLNGIALVVRKIYKQVQKNKI